MKRQLFLLLAVMLPMCFVCAQELKVKEARLLQEDKTAELKQVKDGNGNLCAVIKIDADSLQGLNFPNKNQYVKYECSNGIYLVYVPDLFYKLSMQNERYLPLDIDFKEQFGIRFRGGNTYLVKLDVPSNKDVTLSDIYFNVIPESALLTINEEPIERQENGKYRMNAEAGNYSYSVTADNYIPYRGSFSIMSPTSKTITVKLQPVQVQMGFKCNIDEASLYIDDVNYGEICNDSVRNFSVPEGSHNVRVQADGFLDWSKGVTFSKNLPVIEATMCKNTNQHDIHAVQVNVITNSKRLYKNNKLVKEYTVYKEQGNDRGYTIFLMPGKYMLSDGYNKKEIVTVEEKKPLVVTLKGSSDIWSEE